MLKFIRLIVLAGVASLAVAPATASAGPKDKSRPTRPATSVPEINGKHAGAAIALVIGGVAVVLGRRRRKIA